MANFLDYQCPKCGDTDHIDVAATVWVRLTEDGSDADQAENGDQEYSPHSLAECQECHFLDKLSAFDTDDDATEQPSLVTVEA